MRRILFVLIFLFATNLYAGGNSGDSLGYDDHGKRDPLWKLVNAGGGIVSFETDLLVSDLVLEGIIYDPTMAAKSLAVINGNVVKEKDRLGLYVVSKIDKNKVILLKGQESFILELKKEE